MGDQKKKTNNPKLTKYRDHLTQRKKELEVL